MRATVKFRLLGRKPTVTDTGFIRVESHKILRKTLMKKKYSHVESRVFIGITLFI